MRHTKGLVWRLILILCVIPLLTAADLSPQTGRQVEVEAVGEHTVISVVDHARHTRVQVAREPFARMPLPMFAKFVALSPDGRQVAYVTAGDLMMRDAHLWLVNASGSDRRLLATFPRDFWVAPLVWAPDSRRLAFVRVGAGGRLELWTLDTHTGTQSLALADPSLRPELFYGPLSNPVRWSAGGLRLVYANSGAVSPQATLPCSVPLFAQNDPQWRDDVMQTYGLTIGDAGCALTSAAMVFGYYGTSTDPPTLNACLGDYACPLYWTTAANNCSEVTTTYLGSPGFSWSQLEQELAAGRPPLLRMYKDYSHYVVVISGSGSDPTGYTVHDPWDAQVRSLAGFNDWTFESLVIYDGEPWCGWPLDPPALLEPAAGTNLGQRTITFRWQPPVTPNVDGYTLRLNRSTDPDADPRLEDTGLDAEAVQYTFALDDGVRARSPRPYYWHMRAWRNGQPSAWISRTFTVDTSQPDDGVILYEQPDYGDQWVALSGDTPNLAGLGFDDLASSLRMLGDYDVTLCQEVDYGGACTTFIGDDPDLSDDPVGDDSASSVRIAPGGCDPVEGVVLYEKTNYEGGCLAFSGDDADLSNENFDDVASSLRVIGPLNVTLYRSPDYAGASSTFTADDPDLTNDAIGDDSASSLQVRPQAEAGEWQAEYWSEPDFTGDHFATTVPGPYLFLDWWEDSPGGGFDPDYWSARFTRAVQFTGGTYRFHFDHDDGGRFYIDGDEVIDRWDGPAGTDYTTTLSAGAHTLQVEFREGAVVARLELWWRGPGALPDHPRAPDRWWAQYYGSRRLWAQPVLERAEGSGPLGCDWATGGPGYGLPADHFSARFERSVDFACGHYRFDLTADDGVRLWVDSALLLDEWQDQSATSFSIETDLTQGEHDLKVEYYENTVDAVLHLDWQQLSACPTGVELANVSYPYVRPSQVFTPTVVLRVTGGELRGDRGDHLQNTGGNTYGAAVTQPVSGVVPAGEHVAFRLVMTAPLASGTYQSRWQMQVEEAYLGPEIVLEFFVDDMPPEALMVSPVSGAYLTDTVHVVAQTSDDSGMDSVRFLAWYDGDWHPLSTDRDGSDGWNTTWDTLAVPDGNDIALKAEALDRVGNQAEATVGNLVVDRTPPASSITPLSPTMESTYFIVRWSGTDSLLELADYDVQVREGAAGTWTDWHTSVVTEEAWFLGVIGQSYYFQSRARDLPGNQETYPGGDGDTHTTIALCTPDIYESDDVTATASLLTLGGLAQQHNFCGVGSEDEDEDWFAFDATEGEVYLVRVLNLAPYTDVALTLYGTDGQTALAERGGAGAGVGSWLAWLAPADGRYYACARHGVDGAAGSVVTYDIVLTSGYPVFLPVVMAP